MIPSANLEPFFKVSDILSIAFEVELHVFDEYYIIILPLLQSVFAISLVYVSAITTIKLSIILFYRKLFNGPTFKVIAAILSGVVIAWWLAVILVEVFSCHPISGMWDTSVNSTCVDAVHFYIGVAVPNVATDIAILVLPMRMVWRLQTTLGQNIALSLTFLTGGL